MVEEVVKEKMIYNGPPHKVLVIYKKGGSKVFEVNDGDIFEVTKVEAAELLQHSKNPRYKGRDFKMYKEEKTSTKAKKSSGNGE